MVWKNYLKSYFFFFKSIESKELGVFTECPFKRQGDKFDVSELISFYFLDILNRMFFGVETITNEVKHSLKYSNVLPIHMQSL